MTYFGFLFYFLLIPIAIFLVIHLVDRRRGRKIPQAMSGFAPALAIILHAIIALLYTTIWDNYLVATEVWWYDIQLVTGLTIGYVPIEEYTFFLLQPILAGLYLLFLMRRLTLTPMTDETNVSKAASRRTKIRVWSTVVLMLIWLPSVAILISGWQPGNYLALELAWAIPPIALQLAFGADILWHYRRLVALAIIPLTLFLSLADSLAIGFWGIWTISPDKSLDILLGGVLPVEEFLFFLLTNTLVTFGIVLVMAEASHERFVHIRERVLGSKKSVEIARD